MNLAPGSPLLLLPAVLALIGQYCAWFFIVRSYRLLNAAKFDVVAAMEERLPARAYSRAEWMALGGGEDWRRYLPLTRVEQWVPVLSLAVASRALQRAECAASLVAGVEFGDPSRAGGSP